MQDRILRLNIAGKPLEWLHWQEAATLHARGLVGWTLGDPLYTLRGGTSRQLGKPSELTLYPIIACEGKINPKPRAAPPLTNRALFRRDQHLCLYCGNSFGDGQLTRDHVIPISRGGKNRWSNVVSACRRCNQHKGSYLLNECSMELLALPYVPNHAEYLALINSTRIRGDQMEFLRAQFSKNARGL